MKEQIIKALSITNLSKEEIENLIEVPKDLAMGDFAFPCFILARSMKKNPIQISQDLAGKISSKDFEKVQATGPYINFFLKKGNLANDVLKKIAKEKGKYGSSNYGKGKKIMIEFSQANTHKAFHVGHIRGTSFGESLAKISEFNGNKVVRANYQGDTGMHVAKWIWCYSKYHKKEKITNDESWIASIYVDAVKRLEENEKLQEEVDIINRKLEEGKDKELILLWKKTRDLSLKSLEVIYKELNTHFDRYYFEREFEKRGKEIAKDLVKKGIAKISEGATIIDFKDIGLSVWILLRKDGTVLYSAKDLALAEKKFEEYKLDRAISPIGAAQILHTQQIKKTLELMKLPYHNKYDFIHFSEVRLPSGKMSSRTGENILYSEFMKEITSFAKEEILKREKVNDKELESRALLISVAAIKYSMLKQDANSIITFDKQEALKFEGNTGPYLLYTYARSNSILAKKKAPTKYNIPGNLADSEKALITKLNEFPEIVKKSYDDLAPNHIANYTHSLAQQFNEFYHNSKVIGSEEEPFRLNLVKATMQVLKNALNLLGINVLKKM